MLCYTASMKRIALLLAVMLLCSCTIVNSGSFIDNIGHEHPEVKLRQSSQLCGASEYETWRMEDLYYVKLPVVYSQRYEPLLQSSNIMPWMDRGTWYFPKSPATAGYNRHDYLDSLPQEIYYAALTKDQLLACSPVHISQSADKQTFRLLRASEIDLSKATKVQDSFIFNPDSLIRRHLDDRRSTGNQIRRPLTWALCLVDVPLTLGASAVGLTYEMLALPVGIIGEIFFGY